MKPWLGADRPRIVVGCTMGVVALLLMYWILQFWFLRSEFVAEIEAIQPRTARLLGIVESVDQLEEAAGNVAVVLRNAVYQSDSDSATSAAAMQQNVRELMVNAGLSVSGSQILPAQKTGEFERLGLDITAEGNIDELDEAFSRLERLRPLVFIESVAVTPIRARRSNRRGAAEAQDPHDGDPRKLTVRFGLFSLRLAD